MGVKESDSRVMRIQGPHLIKAADSLNKEEAFTINSSSFTLEMQDDVREVTVSRFAKYGKKKKWHYDYFD